MELPHAVHFYTLAQVGIIFAGFATILMALRETRGRGIAGDELESVRLFRQSAESVNFFFETEDDTIEKETDAGK